jgi:enterobactin synthetase component D
VSGIERERGIPDLERLLPEGITSAIAFIGDDVDQLLGGEREYIGRAVESRQREFAAGRVLARGLLAELGHPGFAIVREKEGRLPVWPEGIVGSISHSDELCMAVVAEAGRYRGVGVDLEPDEPVQQDIERVVLKDGEHQWVGRGEDDERGRRCRMVFSAKEAVYKAFYPTTRTFWSFQDVTLEMDLDSDPEVGRFLAQLPPGAGPDSIEGRLLRRAGWIISSVAVPS